MHILTDQGALSNKTPWIHLHLCLHYIRVSIGRSCTLINQSQWFICGFILSSGGHTAWRLGCTLWCSQHLHFQSFTIGCRRISSTIFWHHTVSTFQNDDFDHPLLSSMNLMELLENVDSIHEQIIIMACIIHGLLGNISTSVLSPGTGFN